MAWEGSTRNQRLPKDWRTKICPRIKRRDGYQCRVVERGVRCSGPAAQVDHIIAGDDHSDANLRSICVPHHSSKSGAEGAAATWAKRAPRKRPPEEHPGAF